MTIARAGTNEAAGFVAVASVRDENADAAAMGSTIPALLGVAARSFASLEGSDTSNAGRLRD